MLTKSYLALQKREPVPIFSAFLLSKQLFLGDLLALSLLTRVNADVNDRFIVRLSEVEVKTNSSIKRKD